MRFPEQPVALNPLRRIFHGLGDQPAAMHAAVFVPRYEPGVSKHAQMLRYGGQRHVVRRSQIANGSFAGREPRQYATASGVGKRGERGIQLAFIIFNHMV